MDRLAREEVLAEEDERDGRTIRFESGWPLTMYEKAGRVLIMCSRTVWRWTFHMPHKPVRSWWDARLTLSYFNRVAWHVA